MRWSLGADSCHSGLDLVRCGRHLSLLMYLLSLLVIVQFRDPCDGLVVLERLLVLDFELCDYE